MNNGYTGGNNRQYDDIEEYDRNNFDPAENYYYNYDVNDKDIDISYREFLNNNQKTGLLRIQVSTADRAMPISGATVRIAKRLKDGVKIFSRTVTNESGIVDNIKLYAPDRRYSLTPSSETQPYASYEITADHPDFIQQVDLSCQIFDGIKSVQFMNMVPSDLVEEKNIKGE